MASTCEFCCYYQKDTTNNSGMGECHRFPPTQTKEPFPQQVNKFITRFPSVSEGDWCGEYSKITDILI